MSKRTSANVGFLLLGGYDLAFISQKVEYGVSDPVVETTPFAVEAAQFEKPGVKTYRVEGYEGWYDDAIYTAASTLMDLGTAQSVLMLAQNGNVAGREAVCAGGVLSAGLGIPFQVGDFHRARPEFGVSGVIDNAVLVCALAAVSGDGNTEASYIDLGAAGGGTTGANVYAACTALTLDGRTDLVITLEDSADHAAWADHTAMTALTDVGAERKASTDQTVNRYVAAKRAFSGAGGSPTATFVLAVKVNSPHA